MLDRDQERVLELKALKRGDLVAEQVKRWITKRSLGPGDKLPKENELQQMFSVSRGTTRDALKSLEVQGLVRLSTGPNGGATIAEVPLGRTLQFVQNYLFFKDLTVEDVYAVRRIIEPEIAAGAIDYLTNGDLQALESSIALCAPVSTSQAHALQQRQEDLHFHEILARANRNAFLRLIGEMINQMLRQLVVLGGNAAHEQYQRFGRANVKAHRAILDAIKSSDGNLTRQLMEQHIIDAEKHVKKLQGVIRGRLVLDSDLDFHLRPRSETVLESISPRTGEVHETKLAGVKHSRRTKK